MQFCPRGENATTASGLSHFHCANDHSEEKYLGSKPLNMPIFDVVFATVPGAADAAASPPSSSEKMWMVPGDGSNGDWSNVAALTDSCRYYSKVDCLRC